MASNDLEVVLRIRALVEGLKDLGLLSDGVDDVGKSSSEAAQTAQALGGALSQLEKEQRLVDNFRDLQSEVSKTDKSLDEARKTTSELAKEMSAAEKPSKGLEATFNRSRVETKKLAAQYQDQKLKLQNVRKEMASVGISTKNLAAHQATLRKELKASEKNLTDLKTKLVQTRNESKKKLADPTAKLNKGLKESNNLTADLRNELARLVTAGALAKFVSNSVESVRKAEASFRGLEAVAEHAGIGIGVAFQEAAKLSADGLLLVTDASKSLQNLLARGYNLDQAIQTINRLKDAAAFNRVAHLSLSEAVLTATEGLKNENSVLVDNAGVTKNVSKLWAEYAKEIGKSVTQLSQAEKIQAEVNGILHETEAQAGNAAKALEGFEGKAAALNKSINDLHVAFGVALFPALIKLAEFGTLVVNDFVKPLLGGVEILAIKFAAFASSTDDMWTFLTSGNREAMAAFDEVINNFELADEMAAQVVERYEEGLIPAAQAATGSLKKQGEQLKETTDDADKLSETTQALVDKLDGLTKKGGDAGDSLSKVFKDIDASSVEGIRAYGEALQHLIDEGKLAASVVRDELAVALAKLSGADLQIFQTNAIAAFGGAADKAGELATLLDGSLSAALKRIGADVHEVETGITSAGQDIIDTFQAIASNAQASGTHITAAFNAALGKLGNNKELQALKINLQTAFEAGKISAAEALPLFAAVEAKLREVKGAAKETKEEFAGLTEASTQAADEAAVAAASWSSFWTDLRDSFYEMSDEIGEAYDTILDRNAQLNHTTFGFFDNLNDGLSGLTRTYQDQETKFNALMRQIDEGTLSANRLESAGNTAARSFGLLGRERLAELRGALDDALRKIERLDESSQRTLEGLQDRLDRLQGNEQDIQQREYERQRKDLEKQLEQAQDIGATDAAADLQKALQLLQQVNRAEAQRIQERQAERDRPPQQDQSVPNLNATIEVNGVTEPEAVARLIEPQLRKILGRSS